MVAWLGEIEYVPLSLFLSLSNSTPSEDLYTNLRSALLARINDKEPAIRVQAVIALSKLCGTEDPADFEDGDGETVMDVLEAVLGGDGSA